MLIAGLVSVALLTQFDPDPRQSQTVNTVELMVNVEQIRQAELTLGSLFNTYTACSSREKAAESALLGHRKWKPEPCWVHVGWEPDDKVAGAYWVEVTSEGFTVHGIADIGGGQFTEVIASKESQAASISAQ